MAEEEKKEEEKKEEEKPEEPASSTKDKLPTAKEDKKSLIQAAKDAAKELREANEERRKLLNEEKELTERKEALAALGGTSPAGSKPEKKEETPQEYKNRIMSGKVEEK